MKYLKPDKLILIGASTGGPGHISMILRSLEDLMNTSIVIAQHMEHKYIPSFVKRLDENCLLPVLQADDGMYLQPAHIYITTLQTALCSNGSHTVFKQKKTNKPGYNPDIDILFASSSQLDMKDNIMGIILTGIGDDGVKGCKLLFNKGARCFAESSETAIVYGMPMQARNKIPGIQVMPINEIIQQIKLFVSYRHV